MKNQILFVDDDASILAGCQRGLRKDFTIDIALGGAEALELMDREGPYAVVVADMQMPRMNGIQFLAQVEARAPDTVRMMLTGNADQKTARDAVNEGHIFRFLTKPCPPEELTLGLRAALEQNRLAKAERELLEHTLNGSVKVLTDILSLLDPVSFGRGQRLRDYVRIGAPSFALPQTWDLEIAAMLSSIGLVTIPAPVLEKVRAGHGLTGPERDMMSRVPQIGSQLLANIPRLEPVAGIVLYQQKNFNGTGFPNDAVAGRQIPMGARILRVLTDLLDLEARGVAKFKALEQMSRLTGKYDAAVLETVALAQDFHFAADMAAASKIREIGFKELFIGARLTSNLLTTEGTLLVTAGTDVTQALLQKLRNFAQVSGIGEPIYIQD